MQPYQIHPIAYHKYSNILKPMAIRPISIFKRFSDLGTDMLQSDSNHAKYSSHVWLSCGMVGLTRQRMGVTLQPYVSLGTSRRRSRPQKRVS